MITFIGLILSFIVKFLPWILLVVVFSEKIRNLIPDSKTGPLGLVRRVFSFVSVHSPNVK